MRGPVVILPCAGYGTRVGMYPHEAKELLKYPSDNSKFGRPMIDYSLELARNLGASKIVVVTRAAKLSLIHYAQSSGCKVQKIKVTEHMEWMDTVLASTPHWGKRNLLLFPDQIFEPGLLTLQHMLTDLNLGVSMSLGVHLVEDAHKWCVVRNGVLWEKPQQRKKPRTDWAVSPMAWSNHTDFNYVMENLHHGAGLVDTSYQYMTSCKDITRG